MVLDQFFFSLFYLITCFMKNLFTALFFTLEISNHKYSFHFVKWKFENLEIMLQNCRSWISENCGFLVFFKTKFKIDFPYTNLKIICFLVKCYLRFTLVSKVVLSPAAGVLIPAVYRGQCDTIGRVCRVGRVDQGTRCIGRTITGY